jgi:hypothetical protein
MGDAAMTLPENPLGLQSFDELVEWTVSYLHFKHALEVIAFTPEVARSYLDRFSAFSSRYATEMKKQDILEARLPKEMRESIEAENAHRALLRELHRGGAHAPPSNSCVPAHRQPLLRAPGPAARGSPPAADQALASKGSANSKKTPRFAAPWRGDRSKGFGLPPLKTEQAPYGEPS